MVCLLPNLGIAFACVLSISAENRVESERPRTQIQAEHALCGRNALFVLASLLDRPAAAARVSEVMSGSIGPDGVSLRELREAAGRIGIPCLVRKVSFEDICRMELPVIVHFNAPSANGSTSRTGHYVVLVDIAADHKYMYYLDPTPALFGPWTTNTFRARWSGYILQPTAAGPGSAAPEWWLLGSAVLLSALAAYVTFRSTRTSHWGCLPLKAYSIRRWFALFCALTMMSPLLSRAYGQDATRQPARVDRTALIWRTPAHDAVNCAYVFLSLNGLHPDYCDLVQDMGPGDGGTRITHLADVIRRCGLAASIEKWTPSDLRHGALPAITHMSSNMARGGTYALVVGCNDKTCVLIAGPTASIEEVSMDSFRRSWSGYVLTVRPGRRRLCIALGLTAALLGVYGVYVLLARCRPGCAMHAATPECTRSAQ